MPLLIEGVLDAPTLSLAQDVLARAPWRDGRETAGVQASDAKRNAQADQTDPQVRALSDTIGRAISSNLHFMSAALPRTLRPPSFNRYETGMSYGAHVDNAIQSREDGSGPMRADLSLTLFLNDPSEYDGGELVLSAPGGDDLIKLSAGDLILYPTTVLHEVLPVTRGARLAAFTWAQSMVPDAARRDILFALDRTIISLRGRMPPGDGDVLSLVNTYHNVLRQWAEV